MEKRVRAYECSIAWLREKAYYNAVSPGLAKASFLRDVWYAHPEVKYTDVRCRVHGDPRDHGVTDVCVRRGLRKVNAGDRVRVGDSDGFIMKGNSSNNFDIFFTSGEFKGLTLNCHPQSQMTFLDGFEGVYPGQEERV